MPLCERRLERRDVDRVSYGEVHGRVDHVAESGLVVLDGATLCVTVPEEDELILLAGPERTHTLSVHLMEKSNRYKRRKGNTEREITTLKKKKKKKKKG